MMKKLTAIVLALMLIGLIPAALADNGFLFMVSFLGADDALGSPAGIYAMDEVEEGVICTLFFDFPNGTLTLMGEDDTGAPHSVIWTAEPTMMLVMLGAVSANYGVTASLCEHGLQLAFRLNEEDQVTGVVANETDAAQLAEVIQAMFNTAAGSFEASEEGSAE